jgi:hypothetical protein
VRHTGLAPRSEWQFRIGRASSVGRCECSRDLQ